MKKVYSIIMIMFIMTALLSGLSAFAEDGYEVTVNYICGEIIETEVLSAKYDKGDDIFADLTPPRGYKFPVGLTEILLEDAEDDEETDYAVELTDDEDGNTAVIDVNVTAISYTITVAYVSGEDELGECEISGKKYGDTVAAADLTDIPEGYRLSKNFPGILIDDSNEDITIDDDNAEVDVIVELEPIDTTEYTVTIKFKSDGAVIAAYNQKLTQKYKIDDKISFASEVTLPDNSKKAAITLPDGYKYVTVITNNEIAFDETTASEFAKTATPPTASVILTIEPKTYNLRVSFVLGVQTIGYQIFSNIKYGTKIESSEFTGLGLSYKTYLTTNEFNKLSGDTTADIQLDLTNDDYNATMKVSVIQIQDPKTPVGGSSSSSSSGSGASYGVGTSSSNSQSEVPFIKGYDDGLFKPGDKIKRAEVAQILYNLYGTVPVNLGSFADVPDSHWGSQAIMWAAQNQYIRGDENGMARPDDYITRAEMAALLSRLDQQLRLFTIGGAPEFSDISEEYWAYDSIIRLARCGIINGYPDGTFDPTKNVTRAEAVVMIARLAKRGANYDKDKTFSDVQPGYWAYDQIMNAVNGY